MNVIHKLRASPAVSDVRQNAQKKEAEFYLCKLHKLRTKILTLCNLHKNFGKNLVLCKSTKVLHKNLYTLPVASERCGFSRNRTDELHKKLGYVEKFLCKLLYNFLG